MIRNVTRRMPTAARGVGALGACNKGAVKMGAR